MRTHLHHVLSEHDHPVVTKDTETDGLPIPEEEQYATIHLSETISITGPTEVIFGWIDELHARSQLVR